MNPSRVAVLRRARAEPMRERIDGIRVPVAVAPNHRKIDVAALEFVSNRGEQREILLIDGALAPKSVVMLADFLQPFLGNLLAFCYVSQKRHHVFRRVRAPEGADHQGVVWGGRVSHVFHHNISLAVHLMYNI